MSVRRKRRVWLDDEKRVICAQTRAPGVSVSQVARRYDVNANLLFTWLRDPRFTGHDPLPSPGFLPLEFVDAGQATAEPGMCDGRIEIDLACGHRIRIHGSYDPEALARLIRGLSA